MGCADVMPLASMVHQRRSTTAGSAGAGWGVFTRMMHGLASEAADEKTIMIDVEPGQRHWFERPGEVT